MDSESFFIYLIFGLIFFLWGWAAREQWAVHQLTKMMSNLNDDEDERIHITVDINDNQIFVYEKSTAKYLAHGKNQNDITDILKERFPGKTFAASEEDLLKLTSFTK